MNSICGVYLHILNLPEKQQAYLENRYLIGYIPSGANVDAVFGMIRQEMKQLEEGIHIRVDVHEVFFATSHIYIYMYIYILLHVYRVYTA